VDLLRSRITHDHPFCPLSDTPRGHFFFNSGQRDEILSYLADHREFKTEILNTADSICDHEFTLLGYEGLDLGSDIDWHRDPVSGHRPAEKVWYKIDFLDYSEAGDVKVIWELNRHQHLVTLAKAYGLCGDEKYLRELTSQWYDWRKKNPYPFGINWASSLEVAFRVLSWIWIRELLTGMRGVDSGFLDELEHVTAASVAHVERYLSTYFSPNTHLLGEGVALFFAGLLCRANDAGRWQKTGWQILVRHAEKQVQKDGFYFEQSTYYHVYALDFFLHARILAERNNIEIPSQLDSTLVRMLEALAKLSACGPPPRFGDDDGGRLFDGRRNQPDHLLDPLVLGSALFRRADWKTLQPHTTEETIWLLGVEAAKAFDAVPSLKELSVSTALTSARIFIMRDSADSMLSVDGGEQGAAGGGHSHADALSIQLSVNGRTILADAGTCSYVSAGEERAYFRGTAAHNTLQVDDIDQMEALGPFPWRSVAAVNTDLWIEGHWFTLLSARQHGYERLQDSVVHRRMVFHRPGSFWFVFDLADGRAAHSLKLHWRLSPGLRWRVEGDVAVACDSDDNAVTALIVPSQSKSRIQVDRMPHSSVYGRREEAEVLQFSKARVLPVAFATIVRLPSNAQTWGSLEMLHGESSQTPVCVYRFDEPDAVHWMFVSTVPGPWQWETLASDAQFFYYGEKRSGDRYTVACAVTFVKVEDVRLLHNHSPANCWSWSEDAVTTEADSVAIKSGLQKLSAWLTTKSAVRA